jgi:hypothetical protein
MDWSNLASKQAVVSSTECTWDGVAWDGMKELKWKTPWVRLEELDIPGGTLCVGFREGDYRVAQEWERQCMLVLRMCGQSPNLSRSRWIPWIRASEDKHVVAIGSFHTVDPLVVFEMEPSSTGVAVSSSRLCRVQEEVLVPGQWAKLIVSCDGAERKANGHWELRWHVHQVLSPQAWRVSARSLASRVLGDVRSKTLVPPEEENILLSHPIA